MADFDVRPPKVEVQWDGANWTDVTDKLVLVDTREGAVVATPDRPSPRYLAGQIELLGADRSAVSERVPYRVTISSTSYGSGWLTDPQQSGSLPTKTRWRVGSDLRLAQSERQAVAIPTGTVGGVASDNALWARIAGAAITARGLPSARGLLNVQWDGPAGGFVSRFAALAGAYAIDRGDGTLAVASPHIAARPAGIATVDNSAWIVLAAETRRRTDEIRNVISIRTPAVHMDTDVSYTATGRLRVPQGSSSLVLADPQVVTADFAVPAADGVTYVDWMVEATAEYLVAGRWAWYIAGVRSFFRNSVRVNVLRMLAAPTPSTLSIAAAGITASFAGLSGAVGTARASIATGTAEQWVCDLSAGISASTPRTDDWLSPTRTWQRTLTRHGELQPAPTGQTTWYPAAEVPRPAAQRQASDTDIATLGAVQRLSQAWGIDVAFDVSATRRVPNVIPAREAQVSDPQSIARWGRRELELPPWLADTTPAGMADTLAGLAAERSLHEVEVAARQPGSADPAALRAGDYAALDLADAPHAVSVHAVCLVTSRRLKWSADEPATVVYEFLETSAPPPTPPAGQPPAAPNPTLTAGDGRLTLTWPAVPGATLYRYRYRAGTSGSWTTHTGTSPVTITGLTNGTSYQVEVQAANSHGVSAYVRRTATPVAPAPPAGTGAVLSLTGTTLAGGRFVQIQWAWSGTNPGRWSVQVREAGTSAWTARDEHLGAARGPSYVRHNIAAGTAVEISVVGTGANPVPRSNIVSFANGSGSSGEPSGPAPILLDSDLVAVEGIPLTLTDPPPQEE